MLLILKNIAAAVYKVGLIKCIKALSSYLSDCRKIKSKMVDNDFLFGKYYPCLSDKYENNGGGGGRIFLSRFIGRAENI
jgi:hypothetical protein